HRRRGPAVISAPEGGAGRASRPSGGTSRMGTNEIIWRPDPAAPARTRHPPLLRGPGIDPPGAPPPRSIEDLDWYWRAVERDLGWQWSTPYPQVVDMSRGIQWPRWFVGGRMNLTAQCVDAHVGAGRGDALAVISEAEDGAVRTLTYRELGREVARLANALSRLGVGAGD